MIFGIGTDLVEISRISQKLIKSEGFRDLIFSAREIEYCNSRSKPDESFAARFAAKEAFLKAMRTGMYATFNLYQIEILSEENGAPFITLSTEMMGIVTKTIGSSSIKINVSLSHTSAFASAFVVIEII